MEFYRGLMQKRLPRGGTFSYAVAINARRLRNEVESITDALKPLPGFSKYSDARNALLVEMSDKDERGNPIVQTLPNGREMFQIRDNRAEFERREGELKKLYEAEIAEQEKHEKDLEELIQGPVEVKVHRIGQVDIPMETTPEQLLQLWPMLKDPVEEDDA